MCECYQIGGPFIAEDPCCPVHGDEARRERDEKEDEIKKLKERIEVLEYIIVQLRQKNNSL